MDDLNLDLDNIEVDVEEKLKVKNRFEKLSEKVIQTAKEKEETEARLKAEAEARTQAEKERDFFKEFSSQATKYPNVGEYQDKIFEKVRGGYSTEDAIVAVLAKEGKLPNMQPEIQTPSNVEGGSAVTNVGEGTKDIGSMTTEDKLNALKQIEKEGGISIT